jgi:serine/threonine-protein kinase
MLMSEPTPPSAASLADPDLSGRRLGDYHLLRRLGRGGMADVYLAQQESLGRQVALKVLKSSLAQDESYVRRFQNEARAAAALVHANIVQIHEVGCLDGIHYIAQEYVDGQSLRQLLQREGILGATPAMNILRQVAAALHKAGQQKITHRDIKPDNIMLSTAGEVKVADFGLARIERDDQRLGLTQIGVTLGTPLYMSPEQVEGRPVDTRSDIYSLGVTCYHMLAGRPPFQGDAALSIAVQHLKTEPEPLASLRPDLPGGVCRIVAKMLAKRPEERYQTAVELLRDLRTLSLEGLESGWPTGMDEWSTPELRALAEARGAATQALGKVMQTEIVARRRHRPWATVAGVASAVLLASLLGGAVAWMRRPPPLLQVSSAELPGIPRLPSARAQYLWAVGVGTEEAWQSVADYHPPAEKEENQYYALRAQQRLAEMFVDHGDLRRAQEVYDALARVGDTQQQFQAVGLAGQARLHMLRNERGQARQSLAALAAIFAELPAHVRGPLLQEIHPQLRPELDRLLQETRRAPKPKPN